MKPEASLPQINPENFNIQQRPNIENMPTLNGLECSPEQNIEKASRVVEASQTNDGADAPTILPIPVAITLPVDDLTTSSISSHPLIANDDDLIEKDWVDKAKEILDKTKDDPYLRGEEVSKLQIDYIKKRYGRELGIAE